jgi:hypothetical protein
MLQNAELRMASQDADTGWRHLDSALIEVKLVVEAECVSLRMRISAPLDHLFRH